MICRYPLDVYSSNIIKLPIKVKLANLLNFSSDMFKTCCVFKEQVLIDLLILQIRPTNRPTFVGNPVYISAFLFSLRANTTPEAFI